MKTLQERMNDMRPYFRGIDVYNDALMVKVAFPTSWKFYPSADERIKVAPSDDGSNVIFFYADSRDTSYDDIFDLIEMTIKENQEIVLKLQLLKDKVEELRELFSNSTYEELKTLKFVLEKQKPEKPKRKYTKKKKEPEPVKVEEEQITNEEETVTNDE